MDRGRSLLLFELTDDEGYRGCSDEELYEPSKRVKYNYGRADLHKEGVDGHQRHSGDEPDSQR